MLPLITVLKWIESSGTLYVTWAKSDLWHDRFRPGHGQMKLFVSWKK